MTEERKPFYLRCGVCGHVWVGAFTPMPLGLFAKVVGAAMCPKSAHDAKNIFLASTEEIERANAATIVPPPKSDINPRSTQP